MLLMLTCLLSYRSLVRTIKSVCERDLNRVIYQYIFHDVPD